MLMRNTVFGACVAMGLCACQSASLGSFIKVEKGGGTDGIVYNTLEAPLKSRDRTAFVSEKEEALAQAVLSNNALNERGVWTNATIGKVQMWPTHEAQGRDCRKYVMTYVLSHDFVSTMEEIGIACREDGRWSYVKG